MRLPLLTPRLQLRMFRPQDAEPLLEVFGDPQVMRYVGATGEPFDREQLGPYLERRQAHWDEHGYGLLAVVERDGEDRADERGRASRNERSVAGRIVGECGIELLEGGPDVELGYTFARSAWCRGYATEAAAAVLQVAFNEVGLERVLACVHPENAASQRVVAKLGMRGDGTAHHYGAELNTYALDREEWRRASRRA